MIEILRSTIYKRFVTEFLEGHVRVRIGKFKLTIPRLG